MGEEVVAWWGMKRGRGAGGGGEEGWREKSISKGEYGNGRRLGVEGFMGGKW